MRSLLLSIFFSHFLFTSLKSQQLRNPVPESYNTDMQRLLIFATGYFVYGTRQGQINMDSAMLFSAKTFGLNRLLLYNNGYTTSSAEATLIDNGAIDDAKMRATKLQGEARIESNALLSMYYLFKAGALKNELDSAKKFILAAKDLAEKYGSKKWERETTKLLGLYYYQANDIGQSQKIFTTLAVECRKNNDEPALGIALQNQANCLPFGNPSKLPLLNEALAIFRKRDQPVKAFEVLNALLIEYFFTADELTDPTLAEISSLQTKLGFKHDQYIHNTYAYLYAKRADYVKAMHHAQAAIASMEATRDTVFSSIFCYRLGSIFSMVNKDKEAEYWNDRAFNAIKTIETRPFWYVSFLGKINILLNHKQPQAALSLIEDIDARFPPATPIHAMSLTLLKGACFAELQKIQEAKKQFDLFLAMSEKIPPQFLMEDAMDALPEIGLFYFNQKDYANAKKILNRSLVSQLDKIAVYHHARLYLLKFKVDSLDGNLLNAIKDYTFYKKFSDSNFNVTQRRQVDELMLQYETAQKDKNIALLKEQQALQQSKLNQSSLTMKITGGGVVLLLIIIVLLYNRYRIKQQASREAEIRNNALQKLVNEKEWLLKEVHHRVKNNLQTIVSLLESQSAYLSNDALLALQDSQNRVYAMSLIHQKLYQADNVASINMNDYLPALVNYLRESFDTRQKIQFTLHIDPIELDVSQAVPIGLILNEAITNSIKYAFNDNKAGQTITIHMHQDKNNKTALTIRDNGAGLPSNFDLQTSGGLGLKLVKGLTEDIEGDFDIRNEHGTILTITFKATTPLYKTESVSLSNLLHKTA